MKRKSILTNIAAMVVLVFILVNCSPFENYTISYDEFERMLEIPAPTDTQKEEFNLDVVGDEKIITKNDSLVFSGYVTNNRLFHTQVIDPILRSYVDKLKKQHPVDAINHLTIFSYEIYQKYFGKGFYRWGGDIMDLDDPQAKGNRFDKKYGLDCSGFVNMPYELAVHYDILDSLSETAAFASKGFKYVCENSELTDGGGREKTPNNYRVDTYDIFRLGRLIMTIEKGEQPTDEQMSLLQPGDLVGRAGHVGIIIEIEDELYYVESGGRILPNNGYKPFDAKKALELWAERRPVQVRRCLND